VHPLCAMHLFSAFIKQRTEKESDSDKAVVPDKTI